MSLKTSIAIALLGLGAQTAHADDADCCDSVNDCPYSEEADMHPECVNYDPQTRDPVPCNETQHGWCAYFFTPAPTYREPEKKKAKSRLKSKPKISRHARRRVPKSKPKPKPSPTLKMR